MTENLETLERFLIPCEFHGDYTMQRIGRLSVNMLCINLRPYSVWKRISELFLNTNPNLSCTLEHSRSSLITEPIRVLQRSPSTCRESSNYFCIQQNFVVRLMIGTKTPEYLLNSRAQALLWKIQLMLYRMFMKNDDQTSSEVDPTYQDPEGDILLLEASFEIVNHTPLPIFQRSTIYAGARKSFQNSVKLKPLKLSVDEPPKVDKLIGTAITILTIRQFIRQGGHNKLPVINC
ncbi:hypothetical protein Tco_1092602 [Tanacetum coccineum]|uniref:Uncharacterized protein n=1 Tax=Tanacetum coccineum TaxID=301880 RepID=A0ABQ5IBM2_9ASTR